MMQLAFKPDLWPEMFDLGTALYAEARALQESLAAERARGERADCCLVLEHPGVLTVGRRLTPSALQAERIFRDRGAEVVRTDRGGEATYHGPGQIILYPVFSLTDRRMGVRRFVELGLESIARFFRSYGLRAEPRCTDAGVWVGPRKLASVGLRVQRGVTLHGFSVNVTNDLEVFELFEPCGKRAGAASLSSELAGADAREARARLITIFAADFS